MKYFINLSTRSKLLVGFGTIWLMLAAVVFIAYRGTTEITQSEKKLHERYFTETLDLRSLRSDMNYSAMRILEMMLSTKKSDQEAKERDVRARAKRIDAVLEGLVKVESDTNFQNRLREYKSVLELYRQTREKTISLIYQGKIEEAKTLRFSLQEQREEMMRAIATELGDKANSNIDQQLAVDMQEADSAIHLFLILGTTALLFSIAMVVLLNKTFVKSLNGISEIAARIAAKNDLGIAIPADDRRDEIGTLTQAFRLMVENLRRSTVDISESKRLEQEMRAASLYARNLIEASLDPLVTISSDGKITDVNKTTEQVTGVSRERLIGSDFADYFTEPDKARAGYKQVFSQGTVKDYPLTIRHSSGRTTDVLYNASVYKNEAGEVQGVFAAARDITERKRMDEELRLASRYARSLIEASLDPLVTISSDGKITDVNKTTEQVTGVSRERLIGSDFADYFTEPEKAREGYKQVFSQGTVKDYPLSIRHSSGRTTDVLYNASVYKNEAGEVQGVFAAARDITERKRIDEELKKYREQLEEMVKQRTAALTDVLSKVKDTVNVLAASSSEIMAATTQVASSTAENATAISETTTTVEEARQAAQLSSEKAKNVSGSAQRVDQVSRSGQKAVEETASGMRHIHDQMESIAQTIVRLSEQSQSIGGIIASVTDLADQSNLLAVNAAIEAAKAGEQGKGFAVVAQEIKSLAEQSKQATAQVRSILSDVQKATSAAVMATERGSKAVEAGVKQSEQAGESIRVLAESSQEAVQTAMQIVASSQQQMVGMDQIGTAMKNINKAGAQNAASVRQAETAAKNLHELGLKLKELVDQFKV